MDLYRGSVAVYCDDDDYLELPKNFEVSSILRKTSFETLNYLDRPISCDDNLITKAIDIMEYMYGYRLFCNTLWSKQLWHFYCIENIQIPVENFDVDAIRSQYGILLWYYERKKQLDGECSDSENSEWWGKSNVGESA
ncbi:hypothetical protein HAX54_008716 [Datura stramonium]|uniref:Uncharacterized protein n=1 Tax=Datura stramonium TaxID=4076 RepID=A0ABS8RVN4_DATST|nr:hypothetical protein [Datura stramonium]